MPEISNSRCYGFSGGGQKGNQGTLPTQTEVYEYTGAYTAPNRQGNNVFATIRMEQWESESKRFYGNGAVRAIDAGRRFTLAGHLLHDTDAASSREYAVIDVKWVIENNISVSTQSPGQSYPHSLQREVAEIKGDQSTGNTIVQHVDGSSGFYYVEIEAQRTAVPFRSAFEHHKPQMEIETATVAGPSGQEVYTDSLNRVKILFAWDRLNTGDENASTWTRVMQSDTGGEYGAVHPPRIGEEVLIGYVSGDCDRPIVLGRLYTGKVTPNWHSNGLLSGFKSKEYGGSGYNQLVMDDSSGQNRTQLYSSTADSALHLGYLINHTNNTRGAFQGTGFDLNTSAYGVVRASKGMYVTTHAKAVQPMDASDASDQLSNAEETVKSLSGAAVSANAESLEESHAAIKRFNAVTQQSVTAASGGGGNTAGGGTGSAPQFEEPVILMASPKDIGFSTKASSHLTADDSINLVSGGDTALVTGKSFIAGVKEKISLFAYNSGIKLFAAKGKVEVQAQSDNVEITAQMVLKLLSATSNIDIAAKRDIVLSSGNAYIRIADGNIQIHAPGSIDIKGSEHVFDGPTSKPYPLPQMPGSICVECLLRAARAKMPFAMSS